MRKVVIAVAAAMWMGIIAPAFAAISVDGGNFTMISPTGQLVGGTNDVKFTWDETLNTSVSGAVSNATLTSDEPFFGVQWFAHDVTIYGEGTYTIYDGCAAGNADCGTGTATTFTVGAGQIGVHMLFDYFPATDIDVVIVWNQDTTWTATNPANPFHIGLDDGTACTSIPPTASPPNCVIDGLPNTADTTFQLLSTDWNSDGIAGSGMTDGPFPGFHASFNLVQSLPEGSPIAGDFTVFTDVDTDVPGIDMLANADDGGLPGTILSLDGCASPSSEGGTVTQDLGTNTCDYLSPGVLAVNDSFTYTVFDGELTSAPGTVTVDVINEVPSCAPADLLTSVDVALSIDEATLLSQCSDPDGAEPLSVDSITVPPANGTLSAALPPFDYTPNAGYIGMDSFQYSVSDTRGGVTTGTANIEVSDLPFGNFTMVDAGGVTFGGTNDIIADWDMVSFCDSVSDPVSKCEMTMGSQSSHPFFGAPWTAHDIRVFKEGSYTFDTIEGGPLNLTIGAGQIGAHMLFDWGQPTPTPCGVANCNIDVVLLWDFDGVFAGTATAPLYQDIAGPTPALDCVYELVSRDVDGDGVPGARMVDGAFIGFRANFNINFTQACTVGEQEVVVSSISNPSSGGCTLASTPSSPLRRTDLWVLLGFIAWLGLKTGHRFHHKLN